MIYLDDLYKYDVLYKINYSIFLEDPIIAPETFINADNSECYMQTFDTADMYIFIGDVVNIHYISNDSKLAFEKLISPNVKKIIILK